MKLRRESEAQVSLQCSVASSASSCLSFGAHLSVQAALSRSDHTGMGTKQAVPSQHSPPLVVPIALWSPYPG